MIVKEFINRYGISATVNGLEVLYNATNDENIANEKYEKYLECITGIYDNNINNYHIIIKITDYELGTHIRKFDSIEDKT